MSDKHEAEYYRLWADAQGSLVEHQKVEIAPLHRKLAEAQARTVEADHSNEETAAHNKTLLQCIDNLKSQLTTLEAENHELQESIKAYDTLGPTLVEREAALKAAGAWLKHRVSLDGDEESLAALLLVQRREAVDQARPDLLREGEAIGAAEIAKQLANYPTESYLHIAVAPAIMALVEKIERAARIGALEWAYDRDIQELESEIDRLKAEVVHATD